MEHDEGFSRKNLWHTGRILALSLLTAGALFTPLLSFMMDGGAVPILATFVCALGLCVQPLCCSAQRNNVENDLGWFLSGAAIVTCFATIVVVWRANKMTDIAAILGVSSIVLTSLAFGCLYCFFASSQKNSLDFE